MSGVSVLRLGGYYSNGNFGRRWSIRQVVALESGVVHYKVVVGEGRRKRFCCPEAEFSAEYRYEVERDENSWIRCSC